MKESIENLNCRAFSPAMVRAMAARDRQVVACVFAAVILFHVALLVFGQISSPSHEAPVASAEVGR